MNSLKFFLLAAALTVISSADENAICKNGALCEDISTTEAVHASAMLQINARPAEASSSKKENDAIKNVDKRQQERSTDSQTLTTQSQALDKQIQGYASTLAPGVTFDFLTTLRLCAPCNKFERFGENNDGGYVMCSDGLDKGLVGAYSYGIKGHDGWGMAVASRYHVPLHEYDCTNKLIPPPCKGCNVSFHLECIVENGVQEKRPAYKTLTQHLQESGNGNAKDRSLLMKIDVEAAEWQVFKDESVENLKKFREIVVEYHWLDKIDNHKLYLDAVQKIEAAGFAVTHLHGNNFNDMVNFDEFTIPKVLEVTYIQKPAGGCQKGVPYNTPGDQPNKAGSPDLPDANLPWK